MRKVERVSPLHNVSKVPFLSLGGGNQHHKKFTKTKSEESGYDSDTTRKSGSGSPRGSVKSDSFETESASSTDLSSNTGAGDYSCQNPNWQHTFCVSVTI